MKVAQLSAVAIACLFAVVGCGVQEAREAEARAREEAIKQRQIAEMSKVAAIEAGETEANLRSQLQEALKQAEMARNDAEAARKDAEESKIRAEAEALLAKDLVIKAELESATLRKQLEEAKKKKGDR